MWHAIRKKIPERGHLAGSCKTHVVGHDERELDVKEHARVEEHPNDRQYDGRQAVIALAQCVAQHESLVQITVGDLIAHLRCDDNLDDNDEMEDEAKLPRQGGWLRTEGSDEMSISMRERRARK